MVGSGRFCAVAVISILILVIGCSGKEDTVPESGGIPAFALPQAPQGVDGDAAPTPVNALNVLDANREEIEDPGADGEQELVNPGLTPDVVVRQLPDATPTIAPTPQVSPVSRCVDDELRLLRWSPGMTFDELAEACVGAPYADSDYELVQSFADCADKHLLLWELSKDYAWHGLRAGGSPQDLKVAMLANLDGAGRNAKERLVASLCNPGPDSERAGLVNRWQACMERDPDAFSRFKSLLADRLGLEGSDSDVLMSATPAEVGSVVYLDYDSLYLALVSALAECEGG